MRSDSEVLGGEGSSVEALQCEAFRHSTQLSQDGAAFGAAVFSLHISLSVGQFYSFCLRRPGRRGEAVGPEDIERRLPRGSRPISQKLGSRESWLQKAETAIARHKAAAGAGGGAGTAAPRLQGNRLQPIALHIVKPVRSPLLFAPEKICYFGRSRGVSGHESRPSR